MRGSCARRFGQTPVTLMEDILAKEALRYSSDRTLQPSFWMQTASVSFFSKLIILLELLVRSHEVKNDGYEYQKGGRTLTVFSAPNYCDQMGNKGAFIRFQGADMEPKITSF